MVKSAKILFSRMTEVEKCIIRAAPNKDRLDWLFYTKYQNEIGRTATAGLKFFNEVVQMIEAEFQVNTVHPGFPKGWKF